VKPLKTVKERIVGCAFTSLKRDENERAVLSVGDCPKSFTGAAEKKESVKVRKEE
jgi:hypothetical protein